MKAFAAIIAIIGFAFSGVASAAGLHTDGFVTVVNYASNVYMFGQYNVRYNTAIAGTPFMDAASYAAGNLYFYGKDSAGTYFSCYVPTSSSIYEAAVDIKNSLGNGSYLSVIKVSTSNECISVYSKQVSYALD